METPVETPERRAFYDRIDKQNMTALWTVLGALVTPEPKSACVPAMWRFNEIRSAMLEAGKLITAKEAERRVLVLENPGLRGQSKITTSLYAGVQMVIPHEVAPAHRHSQSALRFVLEGNGAYTAVDGERTLMRPGDFIITPYMAWHDHGNDTDEPIFWLDGLDIPLIQFLDASFLERLDEDEQPIGKPEGYSMARYGANLLPVDQNGRRRPPRRSSTTPTTARARPCTSWPRRSSPMPATASRCAIPIPVTGDHAMPTMGTFIQLLPKGFHTRALSLHRCRHVRRHGRARAHAGRRHRARMGSEGHLRGAELEGGRRTRPTRRACCSASPTGPCRRRSACGARIAATRDFLTRHPGLWHRAEARSRRAGTFHIHARADPG